MNRTLLIPKSDNVTLLAAGFAIIVWSSAFAAIAYGLEVFTPAELSLLRFLIASAVLAVPVAIGAIKLPPIRDWPAILLLGIIGITVYQLTLGYAMTRISVGAAAVVIALAPGVTSALAALRLGERISRGTMAGLGVAFGGVVLITVGAGRTVRFEPMTLLALVSVLATSIYFVWQKPLLARNGAAGTWASPSPAFSPARSVCCRSACIFRRSSRRCRRRSSGRRRTSASCPTIVGYLCWNFALSRAPASKVSSFLYVQPLVASAIAWVCLGQVPRLLTAIGGCAGDRRCRADRRSSRPVVQPPRAAKPRCEESRERKPAVAVLRAGLSEARRAARTASPANDTGERETGGGKFESTTLPRRRRR